MIKAPVNKIIPLSIVDGPGNRTSIFLQACNIHCGYCHNPETQNMCINCGICVKECPTKALYVENEEVKWDASKCVQCDHCIDVCPNHASPKISWMTAKEVFQEVQKNIPFIRGITVSGGECMLRPEFLTELFTLAKQEGLTCLVDSNGTIDFEKYPELMQVCDKVMLDVKSWDLKVYKQLTGFGNEIVKKNLSFLAEHDKIEELRVVCLPEKVDAEAVLDGIANTLHEKTKEMKLKLIAFRNFGVKGSFSTLSSPTFEYMEQLRTKAESLGFEKIIVT